MDDHVKESRMEASRREMERKSLDTLRIFNPTDKVFRYMFNGFWNTVDSQGTKDVPRYLAAHYLKKITERIIGDMATAKGNEMLDKKKGTSNPEYLDKYVENQEVWLKVPRTDDPELAKEIRDQVILGIVEEYGMELPDPSEAEQARRPQFDPLQNQLVNEVTKRVGEITEEEVSVN